MHRHIETLRHKRLLFWRISISWRKVTTDTQKSELCWGLDTDTVPRKGKLGQRAWNDCNYLFSSIY